MARTKSEALTFLGGSALAHGRIYGVTRTIEYRRFFVHLKGTDSKIGKQNVAS